MTDARIELTEQPDGSWLGEAVIDGKRLVAHGETAEEAVFLLGAAAHRAGVLELEDQLMEVDSGWLEN